MSPYVTAIESIMRRFGGDKYRNVSLEDFKASAIKEIEDAAEDCKGSMKTISLKTIAKIKKGRDVSSILMMLSESMFSLSD